MIHFIITFRGLLTYITHWAAQGLICLALVYWWQYSTTGPCVWKHLATCIGFPDAAEHQFHYATHSCWREGEHHWSISAAQLLPPLHLACTQPSHSPGCLHGNIHLAVRDTMVVCYRHMFTFCTLLQSNVKAELGPLHIHKQDNKNLEPGQQKT